MSGYFAIRRSLWKRLRRSILKNCRRLLSLFDFTKFNQSEQSGIVKHNSRNAFNPILLLCAVITPLFLTAAYLFGNDQLVARCLLIGAGIPVLTACAAYIYFALTQPERLQSESFQLRQQAIELVAQKGKGFLVSPVSLEAISNPAVGAIDAGEEPK